MASVLFQVLLLVLTVSSTLAVFLQKKLLRTVIFLALTATASALIILYMGQTLIALMQILVFVGGLSTYLIVSVATEERHLKLGSRLRLAIVTSVLIIGLTLLLFSIPPAQSAVTTDFGSATRLAFEGYYALFFVAVFLLFACAIGSVLVLKRFSRLVI